jgi:hypothetical protein
MAGIFPWIVAELFGALVPALIAAGVLGNFAMIFPPALAVTLVHAVVLGLPVALVFRVKQWTQASAAIVGGFVIGALPSGVLTWPMHLSDRMTASVDNVSLMVEGVPTWAGWLWYLDVLVMAGALGAASGLAFWLTLRWSGTLHAAHRG